jgi:hypothetical protein
MIKLYKYICILLLPLGLICMQYESKAQHQEKNQIFSNESVQLMTYPNPVTSKLVIKISNNNKYAIHKIEIVNVIGKKIREQQLLDKSTNELYFNDLADVPQGIYLVIARDENGKVIQSNKFMIEK